MAPRGFANWNVVFLCFLMFAVAVQRVRGSGLAGRGIGTAPLSFVKLPWSPC